MYLFYVAFLLLSAAGFTAGYKTGIVKLCFGLLLVTAAFTCSCYFFMPLADYINNPPEMGIITMRIIVFITLCLVTALIIFLMARQLPGRIYYNKTAMGKITGGILATLLTAILFISTAILTGVEGIPEAISIRARETGLDNQLVAATTRFTDLFIAAPGETGSKILSASNNNNESAKSFSISVADGNYISRPAFEKQMLELLNKERTKRGIRPLVYDSSLANVARRHAADMLQRGYFSHNTPESKTPFDRLHQAGIRYRYAGENLAFAPSVLKAHEELMLSPGHKANILSKKYNKAGIAILENTSHQLMIAQEFKD